jgi:hypothetical protein
MIDKSTLHSKWIIDINKAKSLNGWLSQRTDDEFPRYNKSNGELSYPECYATVKSALLPVQNKITIGALLSEYKQLHISATAEIERLTSSDPEFDLKKLEILQRLDPKHFIYLTHHGADHVDGVLDRLYSLLTVSVASSLSALEMFILLIATQVHDVGNIFGRVKHERLISDVADKLLQAHVKDAFLRSLIYKIAATHGGLHGGDKDTISLLQPADSYLGFTVRSKLLASLLRFADEISDDSTRADKLMVDENHINPSDDSAIYHAYATSLNSVRVEMREDGQTIRLCMDHNVYDHNLLTEYTKDEGKIRLVDEIFERMKKLEFERIYCCKHFGFMIPLVELRFKIMIHSQQDLTKTEVLAYTFSDKGYPTHDIHLDGNLITCAEIVDHLNVKGWRIS